MIKTGVSDKIINFLKEDLIQNLNILGVIENVKDYQVYVDDVDNPRGVLVNTGYFNYIYTKDDSFIEDILNNYFSEDDFYGFSGLEESLSDRLESHFSLNWESPCDLYYLPRENFNPSLKKNETSEIDIEDAEKIDFYYTYRNSHSIDRIKEDIANRPTSAIYKDGEIVCWVLVHEDNSMGIMYTMEEHRGNGYAVDVTTDLSGKILSSGKIPFLQINRHNNMSPGLAKKCGFVKWGSAIWFGGIKGVPTFFSESLSQMNSKIREEFNDNILYDSYIISENHKDFFISLFDMKQFEIGIDGLESKKVESDEDIEIWCDIASKGFVSSDDNTREALKARLFNTMLVNKEHYELYLIKIDGKPSSTLGFYILKDEAPCICYVSVLPEFKSEGISDAALYETFLRLKNMDWSIIGIRCNEDKYKFFKNIGAVEIPPHNS